MDIQITGHQIDLGESLMNYVQEKVEHTVTKYFDQTISVNVIFSKDSSLFKAEILAYEGGKANKPIFKGETTDSDIYFAFDQALKKVSTQLNKYKTKIKNHHKKSLSEIGYDDYAMHATKYVFTPLTEENDHEDEVEPIIIAEKDTHIEKLTVKEAVMKMDLRDLPALLFVNKNTGSTNIVYYRKDGNISWIDPKTI